MPDAPSRAQRERLAKIGDFDELIEYLSDELDWPISSESFEDVDDLFYEFSPEELGIDEKNAAKIESIKRLRPLSAEQPWGIFFVEFEPRKLPVVALRRLLSAVALKKRASANPAERQAWAADDLLFVSNYGEDEARHISFAHFTPGERATDLPTLKVLGWDGLDTALHLDGVVNSLHRHLHWPEDEQDLEEWRNRWRGAFRLRHRETITTSKELSIRLAELARNIRDRISTVLAVESKNGPLRKLLEAFKQSLVADLDEKGFADMYAQTIAYGLLSARIVDPEHRTAEDFAAHMRTSPFLRELMESFITLGGRKKVKGGAGIDFDELGVSEVVELLDEANMEAVVADFGKQKQGEDPVIHFYEHFLAEYDKKEKVSRGVFYTPKPVVSYIVRSVDELLRTELGLEDGLADTTTWGEMAERHADLEIPKGSSPDQAFVQILDPATGTGTFLVEVIEIVHRTLMDKWCAEGVRSEKALNQRWNEYVPKHLLPRLHGYELMMAPYAIAHLKIGLKLYETGYRFESEERARIYLTNALEPVQDDSGKLKFAIPALAHEAQAVNRVKADQNFSVVIGNPPYSGFSVNKNEWIDGLLHGRDPQGLSNRNYYEVDGVPLSEKKLWLQDDYVKFLRLSQRALDHCGIGAFGLITNSSYLDGPTHRGLRFSLLESNSQLTVIDLHGSMKRHQDSVDSKEDENVFLGIQQGVAVVTALRLIDCDSECNVRFSSIRGSRSHKFDSLSDREALSFSSIEPRPPWFLFVETSEDAASEYGSYFPLKDAFWVRSTSVQTSRDAFAIGFDKKEVESRVSEFAGQETDQALRERYRLKDGRNWKLSDAREDIQRSEDWRSSIRPYLYRAFDIRFVAYRDSLINWPRHEVMRHLNDGNIAILFPRQLSGTEYRHVFCSRIICDMCVVSTATKEAVQAHPLFLSPIDSHGELLDEAHASSNFTESFLKKWDSLGISCSSLEDAFDVFCYIYVTLHSPAYRSRYSEHLKFDFPRLPLPKSARLFEVLAPLGKKLIALHLLEDGSLKSPVCQYFGPKGQVVEHISWVSGEVSINRARTAGFQKVPKDVWNFHIGGYQVCAKWLKDRQAKGGKNPRPGRILTAEDIAHYQKIVTAIRETIRIMGEIDEVIEEHGGWPGAFQQPEEATEDS